jgi:DNA-directed RNA polymerase specialized sigma subunit
MSTKPKKQPIEFNITAQEIRNICSQYDFNEDSKLIDDDRSYSIKKAMSKLDRSDFVIYCLYLELGTKTDVAHLLGISRISATRIIKNIENEIKQKINDNIDRPVTGDTDNSVHN